MPNAAFSRSCAAWLAEFRPEPPSEILPGSAFAAADEVCERLDRARLRHHQRVGRVVEPEHRRDVLGLVLHLALDRLEHDVRQVDADDVHAVARQLVHLRPHQAAAGAGLVLDDRVDRRALLLQHDLLVARRQVRLAAGRERLPVHDVLVGTRLRRRRAARRGEAHAPPEASASSSSCGRCRWRVASGRALRSILPPRRPARTTASVTCAVVALPPRSRVCSDRVGGHRLDRRASARAPRAARPGARASSRSTRTCRSDWRCPCP